MAAEVLLLGEFSSGKSVFLNMVLGISIMPGSSGLNNIPAVRILADQPAGLWLRQHAEELSTPRLYSWKEIPADWTKFEYVEMTIEEHPLLNKGIILWDAPDIATADQQEKEYLEKYLKQHEETFSSVLFFISGNPPKRAFDFLLQWPKLLERATIVVLVNELKTESQCRSIEQSVRNRAEKELKKNPVELIYIGDISTKFIDLSEEKRVNNSDAEIIRYRRKFSVDIDELAAKHERKDFSSRLFGVVEKTVSGIAVDYQTSNNVVLLYYSELGDVDARIILAKRLLDNGEHAKAINHFEILALKNHPEALVALAECYASGIGVTISHEQAARYWQRAADVGVAEAQFQYAHFLGGESGDPSLALTYLKKAADARHVKANAKIGSLYMAAIGDDKKYEKAIPCLTIASEAGEAEAMFLLGKCYYKGWGIGKDVRKTVDLWEKAGVKNHAEALVELGDLFMINIDRPRDVNRAFRYYSRAAELGYPAGLFRIGSCYDRGEGIPESPAKAVEYYKSAAEKGFVMAQHNLGVCYTEGQGGILDLEQAKYWLGQAAASGYEASVLALNEIEAKEKKEARKGCFIVTAAFGNVSAPEVLFFQHYRDTHLRHHLIGRIFISFYYRIGPVLAAVIRRNEIVLRLSRRGLTWLMAVIKE